MKKINWKNVAVLIVLFLANDFIIYLVARAGL
jgi:hypothetical protein